MFPGVVFSDVGMPPTMCDAGDMDAALRQCINAKITVVGEAEEWLQAHCFSSQCMGQRETNFHHARCGARRAGEHSLSFCRKPIDLASVLLHGHSWLSLSLYLSP